MRCFAYQYLLPTGQTRSGITKLSFISESSAKLYLEQRWQAVIIRSVILPVWFNMLFDMFSPLLNKTVQRDDLVDFFRNLAVMQKSGIPAFDALEVMVSEDSSKQVRAFSEDILESLRCGSSLSESFERRSDVIPESVRYLTQIGESSGTLDRTLADAAEHLRRLGKIVDDAKRALIYPAFVFITILFAVFFWVSYVIPNIADLFKQMQVELPALTLWVLSASEQLNEYSWWALAVVGCVVFSVSVIFKESIKFRFYIHKFMMSIPVSSTLMRSSSLAFITEYLSLLLAAGVNMVESLQVLEQATSNEVYRHSIKTMREGIMRGNALSDEMRQTKIYPGFVVRMIFVGEQSGRLDDQLKYLAEEYRVRFEHIVSSIAEIIQPVVMLLAGGLFLLMIAALFLPIYQLIGQVNNAY